MTHSQRTFYVKLIVVLLYCDVLGQEILHDWIPELYEFYRKATEEDKSFTSLRRDFRNNKEYVIHIQKLKQVNGLKTHNLRVKDENKTPLIYIKNPVESKIPNAFLTIDEFKTFLLERIIKDRQKFEQSKKVSKPNITTTQFKMYSKRNKAKRETKPHSRTRKIKSKKKLYKTRTTKSMSDIFNYHNVNLTVEIKDVKYKKKSSENMSSKNTTNVIKKHTKTANFTNTYSQRSSSSFSPTKAVKIVSKSTLYKNKTTIFEQHTDSVKVTAHSIEIHNGAYITTNLNYTDNHTVHNKIDNTFIPTTVSILNSVVPSNISEKTNLLRILKKHDNNLNVTHIHLQEKESTIFEDTTALVENTTLDINTLEESTSLSTTEIETRSIAEKNTEISTENITEAVTTDKNIMEHTSITVATEITRRRKNRIRRKSTKLTTKRTRRTQGRPFVFMGM